jgi:hypothetical protein
MLGPIDLKNKEGENCKNSTAKQGSKSLFSAHGHEIHVVQESRKEG